VGEWRERGRKGLSLLYVFGFNVEIQLIIRYAFRKDLVSEHLLLVVVKGQLISHLFVGEDK
jgi:hypothetical protein